MGNLHIDLSTIRGDIYTSPARAEKPYSNFHVVNIVPGEVGSSFGVYKPLFRVVKPGLPVLVDDLGYAVIAVAAYRIGKMIAFVGVNT